MRSALVRQPLADDLESLANGGEIYATYSPQSMNFITYWSKSLRSGNVSNKDINVKLMFSFFRNSLIG